MNDPTPVPDSTREGKPPEANVITRQATEEERIKYGIGGDNLKLTEEKLRTWIEQGLTTKEIAQESGKTENCIRVYAHQHKLKLNSNSGVRKEKPVEEPPKEKVQEEIKEPTPKKIPPFKANKVEVMDVIEDKDLNYHCGNALEFICLAKERPTRATEYLKQAVLHLEREIERMEEA